MPSLTIDTPQNSSENDFQPPSRPPPLLTADQIQHVIEHGHLPVNLSPKLHQLHRELQDASKAFFELESCVKQELLPATQGTELGYYHVEDEKEYVTLRHANQGREGLEAINAGTNNEEFRRKVGEARNNLESLTRRAWSLTAALLHRVLIDLSQYIGIDATAWDPILDGCLSLPPSSEEATPSLLRIFLYEPHRGVAAPHNDNGLLTLCVGNEKGLQIWTDDPHGPVHFEAKSTNEAKTGAANNSRRGFWSDAVGPTVLVGTALSILSTGKIAACSHRVVSNPVGRSSVVFALRPSIKHRVDLSPFGGEGSWDMSLLWRRITKGRVNVNAQQQIREDQQRKRDAVRHGVSNEHSRQESIVG